MKKAFVLFMGLTAVATLQAQNVMTPELLWKLGRVSGMGISIDGQSVIYKVSTPSMEENKFNSKFYQIPVGGGEAVEIKEYKTLLKNKNVSPDSKYTLYDEAVKVNKVLGSDIYSELNKTSAQVYESLDYRHWDTWSDGSFNHVFFKANTADAKGIDIMKDEPYHAPQKPFGGDEDYIWSPNGQSILYVCKKKFGMDYALSTNTDIYQYVLATGEVTNLTTGMMGYDVEPTYSSNGDLAWLSMARDGYEADKNDIYVRMRGVNINITQGWDGTVNSYTWSADGKSFYFTAAVDGTMQLFEVDLPTAVKKIPTVVQLTNGDFDIAGIVGQAGEKIVVSRTDMNHAAELYTYDIKTKALTQLTHVNDATYSKLQLPTIERRYVTTTDGQKMLVWAIIPPNFNGDKKWPTLLYCQGGPQSAVSQFYSFRWNFQLMASQGYVVIAPNRRGLPGFGVKWNEQISKDWGGQAMKDYMTAVDDISREAYVDTKRIGAVGASYGGYSVFQLAGTQSHRFKTFISHCGLFNTQSMYGSTEELFFTNWDFGGPYWDKNNVQAQKTFTEFNPITYADKWSKPILIIQGGKDFRVPENQAMEAFQAAQLRGIKSKFVYFPDENHWIMKPQNAMVWQKEFYKWLRETL